MTLFNASAADIEDGDITSTIAVDDSQVKYQTPGTYNVTFSVSDSHGVKSSTTTAALTITDIKPTLTLNPDPVNVSTDEVITDYKTAFGATASEFVEGDLSHNIAVDTSEVDYSTPGEYTITFEAVDEEGNSTTKTGVIVVEQNSDENLATIEQQVGTTVTINESSVEQAVTNGSSKAGYTNNGEKSGQATYYGYSPNNNFSTSEFSIISEINALPAPAAGATELQAINDTVDNGLKNFNVMQNDKNSGGKLLDDSKHKYSTSLLSSGNGEVKDCLHGNYHLSLSNGGIFSIELNNKGNGAANPTPLCQVDSAGNPVYIVYDKDKPSVRSQAGIQIIEATNQKDLSEDDKGENQADLNDNEGLPVSLFLEEDILSTADLFASNSFADQIEMTLLEGKEITFAQIKEAFNTDSNGD